MIKKIEIKQKIEYLGLKVEIDSSEKRPGEKYHEWELRGVPLRLEIGEKEIKEKKVTLYVRDTEKKEKISTKQLAKLKKIGKEFDERLLFKADKFMKKKIINCKTKQEIKTTIKNKKIARVNLCSIEKEGEKCAKYIEKEIEAEVRGTRADKKEKTTGKCIICNSSAREVVYIGKSY